MRKADPLSLRGVATFVSLLAMAFAFAITMDCALVKQACIAQNDDLVKAAAQDIKPQDKLITQATEIVIDYHGDQHKVKLTKVGKNSIILELRLPDGSATRLLRRVIRMPLFKDIDSNYWAKKQIELCVAAGIIEKAKSVYFKPDGDINREEFAKMLANAYSVKPPEVKNVATDVAKDDTNARYINYVVNNRKIMGLEAGSSFRPLDPITRAEAIVAFCKMEGWTENWDMTESPFEDLPPRHKDARWISTAKEKGLLKFAEDRGYLDPDGPLTSAEFAWMMTKTTIGNKAITNLLNWDIGFSAGNERTKPIVINVTK